METEVKYPIGQQDFMILRERGLLYVDKTMYIRRIIDDGSQYFFLARPRRFGKSLFLSTLRYFFEGRRELFRGLYIDSTDWDWEAYPVLRLDLNTDKFADPHTLDDVLDRLFTEWERRYGVEVRETPLSQRFSSIIEAAHAKTGRRVVILVDEYDKPLVGNLNEEANLTHYRKKLASIYANFKSAAEHIQLVFLTGVSRFSKLSVFSDLNNLKDITFSDTYADICGITEQELFRYFPVGIEGLAREYGVDRERMCRMLKQSYDGYRFARKGSEIYNPWSVLNAMDNLRLGDYWNATGAPSVIAEALHDADVDIERIVNARWRLDRLAGLDLGNADPTALLFQTGYLTIADYDHSNDTVRLKVPNNEVKEGLFNELLKYYVKAKRSTPNAMVSDIIEAISDGKPQKLMESLEAYFASIPYDLKIGNENNFHNALYILLTLIGVEAKAEVHTSDGRIDLLIENTGYIYVIELKYDGTAQEALAQINAKRYALPYQREGRKIFKIGVNFSSTTRCLEDWVIESS